MTTVLSDNSSLWDNLNGRDLVIPYFSQKSGRSHASPAISANQKRESAVSANQRGADSGADHVFVKSTECVTVTDWL